MPRTPRILVVDDSESVAKSLALVLQQSGYKAMGVYSSKQALGWLEKVSFDLALIDINLPDTDGLATAVKIRERFPKCKILLVSGDPDCAIILQRGKTEGVEFPVLAKPIPTEELLSRISSLLKLAKQAAVVSSSRHPRNRKTRPPQG